MPAKLNRDKCKGCGLCVEACPKKIMALDLETINVKGYQPAVCRQEDKCNSCCFCAFICPDLAITVTK